MLKIEHSSLPRGLDGRVCKRSCIGRLWSMWRLCVCVLSGVRHSDVAPARRYIFIYSITSRVSFEVVKAIHEKLLMNLGVNTLSSCILVGNKLDLAPSR